MAAGTRCSGKIEIHPPLVLCYRAIHDETKTYQEDGGLVSEKRRREKGVPFKTVKADLIKRGRLRG